MMQGYADASQNGVDIFLLDWIGLVLWSLECAKTLLSVGVGFICARAVSMKTGVGLLSSGIWIFCKDLVCNPSDSNIVVFPLPALYRRMVLQL